MKLGHQGLVAIAAALPLACAMSADGGGSSDSAPIEDVLGEGDSSAEVVVSDLPATSEKAPTVRRFLRTSSPTRTHYLDLSTNEYVCMLHELRGDHLYVESSTAGVFVSDDGEWYLRTRLNRSVGATCATHGSFRVPSGGTRTVFEERGAYATFFSPVSVAIASAHKFGFLTAVQGRFWGLGEAAWVSASSLGYQALWADVDNIYAVGALGRAYHAGLGDQNVLVKLYGYRDGYVRGTLASSGTFTYEVSTVSGYQSFWLPPRDLAICAIERFQGRYETEDDYLRYYENDSQWFGKIDSNHAANGAFRCMAYDQR